MHRRANTQIEKYHDGHAKKFYFSVLYFSIYHTMEENRVVLLVIVKKLKGNE